MVTPRQITQERMKLKNQWTIDCVKELKGKTIKTCRYMTDAEMQKMRWDNCPLLIIFTDGTIMYASQDDEGRMTKAMAQVVCSLQ
jgi:hypothetical protein